MYKKLTWYLIVILFTVGFTTFILGFRNAFDLGTGRAGAPEENGMDNNIQDRPDRSVSLEDEVVFFVLGDSLARGTGDERGIGFVGDVINEIEDFSNINVLLFNSAVEGLRSEGLLELTMEPNVREGLSKADFIFISIGGNDLRLVQRAEEINRDEIFNRNSAEYLENLNRILSYIREENNNAIIVFLGLYNLDYSLMRLDDSLLLLEWNYLTQIKIESDDRAVFVPTYDLFKFNSEEFISPDELHPNSRGYEAIGRRIFEVILPLIREN